MGFCKTGGDSMKPVSIYTLSHPITGEVRYVGKTKNPSNRRSGHVCGAKRGLKYASAAWIRTLLAAGLAPDFKIVEEVPPGQPWQNREKAWIAEYKMQGARLLNHTEGGDGIEGASEETRLKIGAASRGRKHSQESRQQMSESRTGRKMPPGYSEKLAARNRGRTLSDETKALIGAAHRGKVLSAETKQKLSLVRKGRLPSEEALANRIAGMARGHAARRERAVAAFQAGASMSEMAGMGISLRLIGRVFGVCHGTVKARIAQ